MSGHDFVHEYHKLFLDTVFRIRMPLKITKIVLDKSLNFGILFLAASLNPGNEMYDLR